jgi:hypothetical protein
LVAALGAGGENGSPAAAQQETRHRERRDSEESNTECTDTSLLVVVSKGASNINNSGPRKRAP